MPILLVLFALHKILLKLISPYCNSDAMHEHLKQISKATLANRLAVVVMDRAAWHTTKHIYDIPNVVPLFFHHHHLN